MYRRKQIQVYNLESRKQKSIRDNRIKWKRENVLEKLLQKLVESIS